MPRVGVQPLYSKILWASLGLVGPASVAFGTAGKVFMVPLEVDHPITINGIVYKVGGTSAGNVIAGIYPKGSTAESPLGSAVKVQSATTAQSAANCFQVLTVTATLLPVGLWFVGIEGSNTTGTFFKVTDGAGLYDWAYTRSGGYGALTDPCPAVATAYVYPTLGVLVQINHPLGFEL